MAHRTTQRRTLAGGGPEPKPSSMEPTLLKRQPTKPTTTANYHRQNHPNPDPIKPTIEKISLSTTSLSKSLNSDYKLRSYQKPTSQMLHLVDTHLQNKPKKKSFPQEEERKESEKVVSLKGSEEFMQKKKNKFGHSNNNVERVFSSLALVEGGGRRRRSLCGGSHVELGDVFANNGVKVVSVDMPPFMQIHAVECARKTHDSLEKFTSKALALTLKKEFDGVYGPAWHCIVGTSFGSFVTHSVGGFLYFSMDQKLYILLFKTTVERAD